MNRIFYKFIKVSSIILSSLIIIISILSFDNVVFGFDTGLFDVYGSAGSTPSGIEKLLKNGLGIVQVVAGFVAIIAVIWLGVSFMKESPQGKAESKRRAYMVLIGGILVFGASKIVEYIATTANNL